MIEDGDGCYMLVEPHTKGDSKRLGFTAWLGRDRGFTENIIAQTIPSVSCANNQGDENEESEDDMADFISGKYPQHVLH